mmetsp:Transcript_45312/g.140465  ORF Transcript_45312/g.140465 Transcript_45312/m.140465 type:complete len:218 (-) Transcript_45312:11-664(-)
MAGLSARGGLAAAVLAALTGCAAAAAGAGRLAGARRGALRAGPHPPGAAVLCCCDRQKCWEAPGDYARDSRKPGPEVGHSDKDGSRVGYGSGQPLDDWQQEYGPDSEYTNRVGDTCYWKDRKAGKESGDAAAEDCSHSFHPRSTTEGPERSHEQPEKQDERSKARPEKQVERSSARPEKQDERPEKQAERSGGRGRAAPSAAGCAALAAAALLAAGP